MRKEVRVTRSSLRCVGALVPGLLLVALGTGPSGACQCAVQEDEPDQLDLLAFVDAEAVFFGRPIAISARRYWIRDSERLPWFAGLCVQVPEKTFCLSHVITFEVESTWKGVEERFVQIETPSEGPACGVEIDLERAYVVFARRNRDTGALSIDSCGRSRPTFERDHFSDLFGPPVESYPIGPLEGVEPVSQDEEW